MGRKLLPLFLCLPSACGWGASAQTKAKDARVRKDTRIVHEPCAVDSSSAQLQDVNGDGRPDIRRVLAGAKEQCRSVDFNFDGVVDTWVYRESSGAVRRRESDFDRDGRVDEIATYAGGKLTEKQHATNLAGRLDTWHYYRNGRLTRTERDADGDAVIDQWWEYPRWPESDCAIIHSDVDGDGRPDPGATVDLCEDEAPAPVTAKSVSPATAPPRPAEPTTPAASSNPNEAEP